MRREINAVTNIVEKYHHFLEWLSLKSDRLTVSNLYGDGDLVILSF